MSSRSYDPFEAMSTTSFKMPDLKLPPRGEADAELFMEGLRRQVREIEASLTDQQELKMVCWHGGERFQVLSVSMPSNNVVALHCRSNEGELIQVTGHMNAVTFSFRVTTSTVPLTHTRIGFAMPAA